VADTLRCNPETVKAHIRELFPGLMRNGKATLLDEKQITVILESIKKSTSEHRGLESINLQRSVVGIETTKSRALRLEMLYRQIDEIKTAELARLKQEREALQIRLSEAEEWYSVKRVLIDTGKQYDWKPLKEYGRKHGYTVEKEFDKNCGEVNAYHRDVWNAVYGLEL
jgi:hypothetical protein